MAKLPDPFIEKLVARLDCENTLGVTLEGSLARGEGGPYSDVDLMQYVRQESAGEAVACRLQIVDGYLVSIKTTTLEKEYAGLRNPEQAIWVIPGLRQSLILLDKDGSIAALLEAARKVTWDSLQTATNAFTSRGLSAAGEEINKILDGLAQRNESKTLYAIWSLTRGLADILLVQRGMFVPTENAFIDCVQAAAGRTSSWTLQFRLAIGLDPLPAGDPLFIGYGIAGLQLYRETCTLFRHVLRPEDTEVVARTLKTITEAGY